MYYTNPLWLGKGQVNLRNCHRLHVLNHMLPMLPLLTGLLASERTSTELWNCSQPCHPETSELMIWQVDFTCRPPPKWPWTESSCSPSKKKIKHSSLALSVSGGLANEAKMSYKYLASCTIFLHTIYLGYALIWHNLSFNFAQPFSAFKALALTVDTNLNPPSLLPCYFWTTLQLSLKCFVNFVIVFLLLILF